MVHGSAYAFERQDVSEMSNSVDHYYQHTWASSILGRFPSISSESSLFRFRESKSSLDPAVPFISLEGAPGSESN